MPFETTQLSPLEEAVFQRWLMKNKIENVDAPDAKYDMRGFWKSTFGAPHPPGSQEHFPDTFKQHGHPTFSIESQYSKGPYDGGMWSGETYVPQMTPAVSHATTLTSLEPMLTALMKRR